MARETTSTRVTRSSAYSLLAITLTLFIMGILAALCWAFVLPEKFFYDSEYIRRLMAMGSDAEGDRSFLNTARVYLFLGFSATTPREVAAVVVFSLSILPVFLSFAMGVRNPSRINIFLLAAWIGVLSIYLGQYSKELIAIWSVFGALYLLGLRRPLAWTAFLFVAIYGFIFRSYWLLVAGFWVVLLWLSYIRQRLFLKIIVLVGIMLLVSGLFYEAFGYHITEVRERLNEYRLGSEDANTAIRNQFASDSVMQDVMNWLLAWLFILVPLPVLQFLDLQYLAYFALAIGTFLIVFHTGFLIGHRTFSSLVEERRMRGAVSFILAFTLVQGAFEPDYGSVLKHMTNFLPMLAYILAFGSPWTNQN